MAVAGLGCVGNRSDRTPIGLCSLLPCCCSCCCEGALLLELHGMWMLPLSDVWLLLLAEGSA